jgi:hypothetical protein
LNSIFSGSHGNAFESREMIHHAPEERERKRGEKEIKRKSDGKGRKNLPLGYLE